MPKLKPETLNLQRIAALLRELADELDRDLPSGPKARRAGLEPYVGARDVVAQLGCSETVAYEHLRRAARRPSGARGLLRVKQSAWTRYLERHERGAGESTDVVTAAWMGIRHTQPRVKRPKPSPSGGSR